MSYYYHLDSHETFQDGMKTTGASEELDKITKVDVM